MLKGLEMSTQDFGEGSGCATSVPPTGKAGAHPEQRPSERGSPRTQAWKSLGRPSNLAVQGQRVLAGALTLGSRYGRERVGLFRYW